jgi:hypothetical protein
MPGGQNILFTRCVMKNPGNEAISRETGQHCSAAIGKNLAFSILFYEVLRLC